MRMVWKMFKPIFLVLNVGEIAKAIVRYFYSTLAGPVETLPPPGCVDIMLLGAIDNR